MPRALARRPFAAVEQQRQAMTKLKIPHDAIVLIGDGRKALFMRNRGDEKFPDLRVERVLEHDNPPTREQGSDQPGRAIQSYHGPGAPPAARARGKGDSPSSASGAAPA